MKYSDQNPPIVCMQTQSTCYKGTKVFTPKGILWHSMGANNPYIKRYVQPSDNDPNREKLLKIIGENKNKNDWNHIERNAGLNFWIGKLADGTVAAVQTMPWNYRPWGCGSGAKGSLNDTHIQFEICEDGLNDLAYFNAVYKEACEVTAYLCKKYNFDPMGTFAFKGVQVPVIIDHVGSYKLGLGSGHADVQHWFSRYGKTLDDVRKDVKKLLNEDKVISTPIIDKKDPLYSYEKETWDFLKSKGLNDYACAGLMGNIDTESHFRPNNLQNSYEKKLGMTDDEYVRAVDNGTYTDFVTDHAGMGLCQWTSSGRKQNLINFARAKGKSIGDFEMQCDFLWEELNFSYKSVLNVLKTATSVEQASNVVMLKFERPADQSPENQKKRSANSQIFYDKYATQKEPKQVVYQEYTVVKGDTLSGIARKLLGDSKRYPEIKSLNGLSSDKIKAGQVLKIPAESVNSSNTAKYIVKKGETLWSIATKMLGNGERFKEIMSLNGLSSSVIQEGQELTLPIK